MAVKVTIDAAGRLVIPKTVRRQLRLAPGDTLELEAKNDRLILRPLRPAVALKKKRGVWVYHSEQIKKRSTSLKQIERDRDRRIRELMR